MGFDQSRSNGTPTLDGCVPEDFVEGFSLLLDIRVREGLIWSEGIGALA